MILSPEQDARVDEMVDHVVNSSKQVYELHGGAGTGKSVVLYEFIKRCKRKLGIEPYKFLPMAYTGAAAMVMRKKGFFNARTIHSSLYEPKLVPKIDDFGKPLIDPYYGTEIMVLEFVPKPLGEFVCMIIDEGYMVPMSMRKEIESRGLKIVVGGDSRQLKPVRDEPAYLYDMSKVHHLTQTMRQVNGMESGILHIAERALRGLPIHTGYYGDCIVIYEDELTPELLLHTDMLICGKNATRDKYNKYIREDLLRIDSDLPLMGERVICRKNDNTIEVDGINLANGLSGRICCPMDQSKFQSNIFTMDFKPDLFDMPFLDLKVNYNYFIADYKERDRIKNDRYRNVGQLFEMGYASTTHLAQGSQARNVIYIEEGTIESNVLNYTGATRASDMLIYCKRRRKFY